MTECVHWWVVDPPTSGEFIKGRCKRCGVGGKDLGLRWKKSKGGKFYLQGCYQVVVRDGENASEEQSWLPHFKFCAANPSRIVEAT